MGLFPFVASTFAVGSNRASSSPRRPTLPSTSFSHVSATEAGIRIGASPCKGLGAFATAPIAKGSWVGDYEGEILTRPQVAARYWKKGKKTKFDRRWIKSRRVRNQGLSGDYLFDMGGGAYIDGEDGDVSNWCRFMNHAGSATRACNLETRYKSMEPEFCPIKGPAHAGPRLWFLATRDIDIGEELCYDYGDFYWD